jgi:hypothetical protein
MEKILKNIQWKEFFIEDIFNIQSTNSGIDRNKLIPKKGNTPYITRTEKENGYDSFICEQDEKYKIDNCNVITIGLDTQTVFYQPYEFYTGQNIQILTNSNLNKYNASFFISLLKVQMEKFSWGGNGATLTRLRRSKILLPSNIEGQPDYAFMEHYIRDIEEKKIKTYKKHIVSRIDELKEIKEVIPFSQKKWDAFCIEDIAEIVSGKDIYEIERTQGNIPYITSTALNNGIGYLVGNSNQTFEANCLSVNRNGSVGYSFYHPYLALFSNDCRKLRLKYPSKYVGVFIARQITSQKEKYGYGYKMGTARLKRQKIMLPIDTNGEPDYNYMENYVKKLEYDKLNSYLIQKMYV